MASTNKDCAVLHCESRSSSDVEFYNFPQPNDPRYAMWIERTLHVARPDSPEIIYQEPQKRGSRAVISSGDVGNAGSPAVDTSSLPTSSVDEDLSVCCVPGCPSRGDRGDLPRSAPTIRFHAFPSDQHLHWEWTKRVRCSVSWRPAPFSVVCSAHFAAADYDLISGMLCLKPTAIPRHLASVGVFMMRRTDSPGMFDRMCAICGCWRMRIQKHYKPAARLAFFPFPTDPDEREKWNALCKGISCDAELLACENHFLLNEIVSRFQECGEEKFTVRRGVVPRMELTLWLDPVSSPSGNEIPRTSAGEDAYSAENHDQGTVQIQETVSNTPTEPKLVVLFRDGAPGRNVHLCSTPGKLPVAKSVENAIGATEVCCVPGCIVTASNAGELGGFMFRFISSRVNSRYNIWINRIRCAITWEEKYPLAICSRHFLPDDFDPQTRILSPNALPSQLSCISTFHFSGLREGETDDTGMQICVVCDAKRKPGSTTKSSELLNFFPLPIDLADCAAWCKFISAQRTGQNVDAGSLLCENHFLPTEFIVGGGLKPSTVPSCTLCLQPEFRPFAYIRLPVLTAKIASCTNSTQRTGSSENSARARYQCCVSGCKIDWMSKREKIITFFKFVAADDPRYETWLERVRPELDWVPDKATVLCSDHFLPSQITLRISGGVIKRILSETALPSLLNGECRWQPGELQREAAMMETVDDDGMVDLTETDYDEASDTQLVDISSVDDGDTSRFSAVKWQIRSDNGLPEDDADDPSDDNSMHLMDRMPQFLAPSTDDEPTESPQPLLAADSALIYCAECQIFLRTPCWLHSNTISDQPVISLAVGSLPNVLYMDVCDHSRTGKTVFAKDAVPRHTVFGPLVAPLMAEEDAGAQYFDVSEAETGSRRKHYHLESDSSCNWMKYVRFADSMEASNLLVFARGVEIVFVTSRTISCYEELRAWYSVQYTELITDVKPFIPDLHLEREATVIKADALEFVEDGASPCDVEDDTMDIGNVSLQIFPATILPAITVPPLTETIHSDFDITMNQTQNRKKRILHSFDCHDCDLRFTTASLYRLHKYKHGISENAENLQFPEECPQCKDVFEMDSLVVHVNVHGKPIKKCPVCDLWVGFLSVHMKRVHPDHEYRPDSQPGQAGENVSASRNRSPRRSDMQPAAKSSRTMFHRSTCYECRLRFPTEMLHQLHSSRHETSDCSEWPEKCPECDLPFDEVECPVTHVDSHAKRVRKCQLCYQWRLNLTMHMRRIHPDDHGPMKIKRSNDTESAACMDCGLRFPSHFLCGVHETKHGREEYVLNMTFPRKCPECDQVFEERSTLVEHVDAHGKLSKKCPVCRVWLTDLSKHLRRIHPQHHRETECTKQPQKNLTCLTCGVRFPTEILLQLHSFQHATWEDGKDAHFSNECPHCERVFQELSELAQHVDEHGTAVKKCPVCELWFGCLRDHVRLFHPGRHLEPKESVHSLTCQTCGVRFPTAILRQVHSFQHRSAEDTEDVQFPKECPQCDRVFQELSGLALHVDEHGTGLIRCPVCELWFDGIRNHMRHCHPDYSKNLTCRDCGLRIPRRSLRKRSKFVQHFHRLMNRPTTVGSTCYYCNVRFPREALCSLHIFKHGRKECAESLQFPQECPECCEVFEGLPELVEHVAEHGERVENGTVRDGSVTESEREICDDDSVSWDSNNDPPDEDEHSHKGHECLECGKEFRLGLQAHAKACQRRIKCGICSEIFQSKSNFDQHTASHKTDEGFLCGICLEKFPLFQLLISHVDKHGSENPAENSGNESSSAYMCVLCRNGFASSDELNKHVKGHEGRDGFTCPVCNEKFPFYRLLSRHMSDKHRSPGPSTEYSCTICSSAFSRLNDLEIHLCTHDVEQQFKCDQPQCGKRFVSIKSLQGHVFDVHTQRKRKATLQKLFRAKRKKGL